MTKNQVDTLKGLAILQVVFLHIISVFPELWWKQAGNFSTLLIYSDQLSRLSIPIFIFLSWFGLVQKYQDRKFSFFPYIKDRISKILPLYILWSAGFWLIMQFIPIMRFAPSLSFFPKLLLGQHDYHLYFVPLIMMLYLLFGMVYQLPRKITILGSTSILLLTLWWYSQLPTFQLFTGIVQPDQIRYLIPLTWLWYAWMGLVIGEKIVQKKLQTRWFQIFSAILTIVSGWIVFQDALSAIATHGNVLLALQFSRLPVLAFATTCILFVTSTAHLWKNLHVNILEKLGKYSFFIYLSHTMIIRLSISQWFYPLPLYQWLILLTITSTLLVVTFFWPPLTIWQKKTPPPKRGAFFV